MKKKLCIIVIIFCLISIALTVFLTQQQQPSSDKKQASIIDWVCINKVKVAEDKRDKFWGGSDKTGNKNGETFRRVELAKDESYKFWGGSDKTGNTSGKAFDLCNQKWLGEGGQASIMLNASKDECNNQINTLKTTYQKQISTLIQHLINRTITTTSVNGIYYKNIYILTFEDGYLNFPNTSTINYILVGGGGAGGNGGAGGYNGGGGGGGQGGQIVQGTVILDPGIYKITLGIGGTNLTRNGTETIISKINLSDSSLINIISAFGGIGGSDGGNSRVGYNISPAGGNGGGTTGGIGGYREYKDGIWYNAINAADGLPGEINVTGSGGGGGGSTFGAEQNGNGADGGKLSIIDYDNKSVNIYGNGGCGGGGTVQNMENYGLGGKGTVGKGGDGVLTPGFRTTINGTDGILGGGGGGGGGKGDGGSIGGKGGKGVAIIYF